MIERGRGPTKETDAALAVVASRRRSSGKASCTRLPRRLTSDACGPTLDQYRPRKDRSMLDGMERSS